MSNFRRQDAWRQHPLLTNGMKDAFPGFKRAAGIFAVYVVVEQVYKFATRPSSHHIEQSVEGREWTRPGLGQAPVLEVVSSHKEEEHHH